LKLLKGYLAQRHAFEQPVQSIEEAVTNVAYHERFHPVREYLESLTWDGVPRLDFWLRDYLYVEDGDSEYVKACARKTLCAAIMRVMRPGVKYDHILVLEGAQDIGKSSVCQILGGKWSSDFPVDPHSKDTVQLMQGTWILELAELEVTRKADMEALKAFVTRRKDQARLAYGRTVGEFPRQSIFIGTKNPRADGTYLSDDTGNRRWWPVRCEPPKGKQINFRGLKDARNQLFAEAFAKVKSGKGEHLYMETLELKTKAADVVALRHADHEWTERVAGWLWEKNPKPDFLTAREVFIDALSGTDRGLDRRSTIAIAQCLRSVGWKPGFKRIHGRFCRGYVPDAPIPTDNEALDILADL